MSDVNFCDHAVLSAQNNLQEHGLSHANACSQVPSSLPDLDLIGTPGSSDI